MDRKPRFAFSKYMICEEKIDEKSWLRGVQGTFLGHKFTYSSN